MEEQFNTPSHVIVYVTSDYDRFRFISGNRGLDLNKCNKIIDEIKDGNDMLENYPIIVKSIGPMLEIIDGQNRFWINKKLDRPVYYIIADKKKTMADIARVNSNVGKWLPQNFIDCYISYNNENYILLQKFMDKYDMNIGISVCLLSKGVPDVSGLRDELKDDFQKGRFVAKFYKEAAELAEDCRLFSSFSSWRERNFVYAIYKIKQAKKVTIEELHQQFLKNSETLIKNSNVKQYIYNLEQVMNFKKHQRIIII